MKNRRLNVLFIAIIGLAAAPQALQDAGRLASAAQERAESEFWTIFLSYQTPAANGAETRGGTELVADNRSGAMNSCPLERIMARANEAMRDSQTNENSTPARFIRQTMRASAKARPAASQPVEPNFKDETVASVDAVRPVEFSEKEKNALRAASLHGRDTEKLAVAASKASLAFSWQENENMQIKVKPAMEVDKLLRRKVRNTRDRRESGREIPAPTADESM